MQKLLELLMKFDDFCNKIYKEYQDRNMPPEQPSHLPTPDPDALLSWDTIEGAHHNVRAVCDLEGLSWNEKQILTACVKVESAFNINARHINHDGKGNILSTDFGIVQINDYYHIGSEKDFPSIEYVLDNPEACVRWMCHYYKTHGNLNAWVSYSAGLYKQYLGRV